MRKKYFKTLLVKLKNNNKVPNKYQLVLSILLSESGPDFSDRLLRRRPWEIFPYEESSFFAETSFLKFLCKASGLQLLRQGCVTTRTNQLIIREFQQIPALSIGICSASPIYVYPGEYRWVFIYYAACIVDRFLCNVLSLFRVLKLSGDILQIYWISKNTK